MLLCACALPAPATEAAAKPSPKKPTGSAITSDSGLEREILNRFNKSKISASNFKVRVQGGVATIEGKTDVVQHKGTATRLARLAGAKQVNNRIQVSESGRAKAAKSLPEGRRRAQLKRDEERR